MLGLIPRRPRCRRNAILVKLDVDDPMYGKSIPEIEIARRDMNVGIEKKKWIILFAFVLFRFASLIIFDSDFSNCLQWITFSPIISTSMAYYGVDNEIDMHKFSNSYMFMYIIFSFFVIDGIKVIVI